MGHICLVLAIACLANTRDTHGFLFVIWAELSCRRVKRKEQVLLGALLQGVVHRDVWVVQ